VNTITLIAGSLSAAVVATAAHGGVQGIVSVTGDVVAVEQDGTVVGGGALTSNSIAAVAENRNVVLQAELRVNIINPGLYDQPSDIRRARVAQGTAIDSFLVSIDGGLGRGTVSSGSITFDRDVVGILIFDESLNASDDLFAPGQIDSPEDRGVELLETGSNEFITLSSDRRTVELQLGDDISLDQVPSARTTTWASPTTRASSRPASRASGSTAPAPLRSGSSAARSPRTSISKRTIAEYMGTEASYTFVSCWTANEAIYPTFAEPGDMILSDELNHACIIDGIRLAATIKKGVKKGVYKHADYADLRDKLVAARADPDVTGQIWVVTDGVFSMEGDIADLPAIRGCATSSARCSSSTTPTGTASWDAPGAARTSTTAWSGPAGAGNDIGEVDFFTGTLGKALGGGAGGFVAGQPKRVRAAHPARAGPRCSATRSLHHRVQRQQGDRDPDGRARARARSSRTTSRPPARRSRSAGFDVLESPTAILPDHRRRHRRGDPHEQTPARTGRVRDRVRLPGRARGRGPPPHPDVGGAHRT
jgi:hypothetical protein